ncbi:hypothetical protein HG535_0E01360 [Zygotorulaspora mrakii]|uniref:Oxidation resistance protein 1 n=1 Tax=Zygotorulaspora mrakii TaxID=42260 RepID=A0A7H9B5K9_ZYGMR|nr:uncharacterized protein HG535_0E01360 [Zygotorulaspora mrakii]QLG73052.1 hypothetical protein HG535_0E01360 [Zygotorulaspora mrakii]
MFDVRGALNKVKDTFTHEDPTNRRSSKSPEETFSRSSDRSSNRSSKKFGKEDGQDEAGVNSLSYENDQDDEKWLSVSLKGYSPNTKCKLLTPEMCDEIRTLMPMRVQLYTEWKLLYSLEQHGASLKSLYHNVVPQSKRPARVGYVIIIQDRRHGLFGAYCNEPFHPTENRRYYGNGECFLWKMDKVPNVNIGEEREHGRTPDNKGSDEQRWQFRGYPFTGLNEFAIYCQSDFLSMGAGDGHYGLWLDDSLIHGVSNPSLTFGNDVLSREGKKFHVVALEVWKVG